ncbi:MAG: acyloxyacyl hydrolase [Proteobacteria bacterium]|nr:acyloxyacyl hydrolase [Pseudomonadota bacterium]
MTRGFVVAMLGALAPAGAHAASINSIYDMNRMLSEPHPLAGQYGTRWKPAVPAAPVVSPGASPIAPPSASPGAPAPLMAPQLRLDPGTSGVPVREPRPAPRPAARPKPRSQLAPSPAPPKPARKPKSRPAAVAKNKSNDSGGLLSEIKIGALAQDQGPFSSNKEDGITAHVELRFASPDILKYIGAPTPHIGADINTSGNTNSVWLGVVWEWEVWKRFFVGWSMGGAYHDGETDKNSAPLDRKELGCNPLFRLGINVGWRFDKHHSIDLLMDHISNAKICDTNEGLENVGVRYGYRF